MNPIPPTQYRAMQEDVTRYKCLDGVAYLILRYNGDCEPMYLPRMEELFGVSVKHVYINVYKDFVLVAFNSKKPIFATCSGCGKRFNTRRVWE